MSSCSWSWASDCAGACLAKVPLGRLVGPLDRAAGQERRRVAVSPAGLVEDRHDIGGLDRAEGGDWLLVEPELAKPNVTYHVVEVGERADRLTGPGPWRVESGEARLSGRARAPVQR